MARTQMTKDLGSKGEYWFLEPLCKKTFNYEEAIRYAIRMFSSIMAEIMQLNKMWIIAIHPKFGWKLERNTVELCRFSCRATVFKRHVFRPRSNEDLLRNYIYVDVYNILALFQYQAVYSLDARHLYWNTTTIFQQWGRTCHLQFLQRSLSASTSHRTGCPSL